MKVYPGRYVEEEENKGDDMARVGCGEARKKTRAWLMQLAEKRAQSGKPTFCM